MAKKEGFNFAKTPSANEIDEEMSAVDQPTSQDTTLASQDTTDLAPPKSKRLVHAKKKSKVAGWTLVQCHLPNDLNSRMIKYNYKNATTKNDFLIHAVRRLLDELGV